MFSRGRNRKWRRGLVDFPREAAALLASAFARLAATETEAYYIGEALPIHRVALRPKKVSAAGS